MYTYYNYIGTYYARLENSSRPNVEARRVIGFISFIIFWSSLLGYNNNMFLLNYSKCIYGRSHVHRVMLNKS